MPVLCKKGLQSITSNDYLWWIEGKLHASREWKRRLSVDAFKVKGQGRGRMTVSVEELKVLVHIHLPPQVFFQVLDPHFWHFAVQAVLAYDCERWKEISDVVRSIYVVVGAAVGRPHLFGDAHAVLVVPTDGVARRGHPGNDVGFTQAEVVEAYSDPLYVPAPAIDFKIPYQRDHVGEGVGGGPVFDSGLVLVRIQLTSYILDHIGVVIQHRLAVFKGLVQVTGREGHHVPISVCFCKLKRQIQVLFCTVICRSDNYFIKEFKTVQVILRISLGPWLSPFYLKMKQMILIMTLLLFFLNRAETPALTCGSYIQG